MRKRIYMALLAAVLTLGLPVGCMTASASQTEANESVQTEQEEGGAAGETETSLLEPESVTGETSFEDQYPTIEAQVEQQLSTLSKLSADEVEDMINGYNRQINLSVLDIKNSMDDASTLTEDDDATMAMVKMLRNWYSNMDSCGQFLGVKSYTADMTDQVMTMERE